MVGSLDTLTTAIEGLDAVKALKFSRLFYSLVNLAHILGIALLIGAILPMDLRLMGVWGRIDRSDSVRLLAPVAATGLLIAVLAGLVLFSVRASDYADDTLLGIKLALIITGTTLALFFHLRAGIWLDRATPRQAAWHGAASLLCWLGAASCGRLIAYFPN